MHATHYLLVFIYQIFNIFCRWFPAKAKQFSTTLLQTIQAQYGQHQLLFELFSGATKNCFYQLLQLLATPEYSNVKQRVRGVLYDSSPVDFVSDLGYHAIVNATGLKNCFFRYCLRGVQRTLDFFFKRIFEQDREVYWKTLLDLTVCAMSIIIL